MVDAENKETIFIVGASRSGTTLLSRMLGTHSKINTFEELHFYNLVRDKVSSLEDAERQINHLFVIEREKGLFDGCFDAEYTLKAKELAKKNGNNSNAKLLPLFLQYETKRKSKRISCEQTPLNLFYIEEIRKDFGSPMFLHIARDPRAVLASQKKRWVGMEIGDRVIPKRVVRRLKYSYNPIIYSYLWKRSMQKALKYRGSFDFFEIKFEELLSKPSEIMKGVCDFVNVKYEPNIINVSSEGSSHTNEKTQNQGVIKNRAVLWKGVLSKSEMYICEKICKKEMLAMGYTLNNEVVNPLCLIGYIIQLVVKIPIAMVLNMSGHKNILAAIVRRLK